MEYKDSEIHYQNGCDGPSIWGEEANKLFNKKYQEVQKDLLYD